MSLCSVIAQNKLRTVRSVNQDGAQVQVMTSYANKEFESTSPCSSVDRG